MRSIQFCQIRIDSIASNNTQYFDTNQYISTFSIISAITSIYRTFYEFLANSPIYRIYLTMSKYLREFYHSVRMTILSFTTHSSFSNRASEIVCKHSKNAFFIFEFASDFFFDRFFFAFVSTQMIRERKIFEFYITSTRTQTLLMFRDAVDSLKSRKYKKNILCVSTSCK